MSFLNPVFNELLQMVSKDLLAIVQIRLYHKLPAKTVLLCKKQQVYTEGKDTQSEYFIKWHEEDLTDIKSFNNKLMDFCLWYNIEKPHKGLNKLPPLKYYVNEFVKQPAQSNMSWTPTKA
jgi:hypothetical protein